MSLSLTLACSGLFCLLRQYASALLILCSGVVTEQKERGRCCSEPGIAYEKKRGKFLGRGCCGGVGGGREHATPPPPSPRWESFKVKTNLICAIC